MSRRPVPAATRGSAGTLRSVAGELWICHLGEIEYRAGVALQEDLRGRVKDGSLPEVLLLLEHPAVYTLGRRSGAEDLPLGEEEARARGIDVVRTDRGGKLTYHGPGQLVGYPIMRVGDVVDHLRTMEAVIVAALADEGLTAAPREGARLRERLTGVWVADRKIASIGIHVSRGVSTHGFAVNVENDLRPFEWVVPCGLDGVRMTSVLAETGREGRLAPFRAAMARHFCAAFGRRGREVGAGRLGAGAPLAA
jgi:lipoyl(octanoyl) transferase